MKTDCDVVKHNIDEWFLDGSKLSYAIGGVEYRGVPMCFRV